MAKPSRILYIGQGLTGSGHMVRGLSIFQGLSRSGWKGRFTIILSHNQYAGLAESYNVEVQIIPLADPRVLAKDSDELLPRFIRQFDPDLVLINQHWFTLQPWLNQIKCPCWILFWQTAALQLDRSLVHWDHDFQSGLWSRVLVTEPFSIPEKLRDSLPIDPILICNPDEIRPRDEARSLIKGNASDRPIAMIAANGKPGEMEAIWKKYSALHQEGYEVITASNLGHGFFPLMNYFNAIDLLVTSPGYHGYWEARYLNKNVIFEPFDRTHENQARRLLDGKDYQIRENGADTLARMIGGVK